MDIDCCCGWSGNAGSTSGGTICPNGCPKEISVTFSGVDGCPCVGATFDLGPPVISRGADQEWNGMPVDGSFIGIPFFGSPGGICSYGGTLTGSSGDFGINDTYLTTNGSCGGDKFPFPAADSITILVQLDFTGTSGTCFISTQLNPVVPIATPFVGEASFTGQSACGSGGRVVVDNIYNDCEKWNTELPGLDHFTTGGQAVVTW